MKQPSFPFYPGDWIKDPELSICSATDRGVWMDALCLMWECTPRGYFISNGKPWSLEQVAAAIRGDRKVTLDSLKVLLQNGVLKRNKKGVFFSKKLAEIEEERSGWRAENRRNYLKRRGKSRPSHSQSHSSSHSPSHSRNTARSSSSSSLTTREEKRRTTSAEPALVPSPNFSPPKPRKATPQQARYARVRELITAAKSLWRCNSSGGQAYTAGDWKEDLKLTAAKLGIPYSDNWRGVSSPIDIALEIAQRQIDDEGTPH